MAKRATPRKPKPPAGHGHPRPLLQRQSWTSLNGPWDFVLDPKASWRSPREVQWNGTIIVPFSPETPASGIGDTSFYRRCWYRRTFEAPRAAGGRAAAPPLRRRGLGGDRLGQRRAARSATKGDTRRSRADITELLDPTGPQTVVVRADDDPADLAKPRGKQDWQLEPHSIWYPRTTGIWQTVWLEKVPRPGSAALRWTPSLERWEIGFEAWIERRARANGCGWASSCAPTGSCSPTTPTRWSPARCTAGSRSPIPASTTSATSCSGAREADHLIEAQLQLWAERGELLDEVAQLHRAALDRRAGQPAAC